MGETDHDDDDQSIPYLPRVSRAYHSITQHHPQRTTYLRQKNHMSKLLESHNMAHCHTKSIPLDPGTQLRSSLETTATINTSYQSMIGMLMYAMTATRPDLAFAVSTRSQFNSSYDESHLTAAKQVLKYCCGSFHFALKRGPMSQDIVCYTDADYAGDLDTRKLSCSTSWCTCHLVFEKAVYRRNIYRWGGISSTSCLVFWNHFNSAVVNRASIVFATPISLKCDNHAAIIAPNISKSNFILFAIESLLVLYSGCECVQTQLQYADCLTKQLPRDPFAFLNSPFFSAASR